MKTIEVKIFACYGYGCCGGSHSSEKVIKVDVSEKAGTTIMAMLNEYDEVDQTVFEEAIKKGHKELKKVYEEIDDKHSDMVARYWLFEAPNDEIDLTLEPYFWKDIEEKLYTPEQTLKEYIEDNYCVDYDEQEDYDEESVRNEYYEECKKAYLSWVNSHEDDYWFIADRTDLCLDLVYSDKPELEFVVNTIMPNMDEFLAKKERKNYYMAIVNRLSVNNALTYMCQFDDDKVAELKALKEKYGEKEYLDHIMEVVTDDELDWDTENADLKLVDLSLDNVYHLYEFTIHELLPNGKMREKPTMLLLTDEEYMKLIELRLHNQRLTFNSLRFDDPKMYGQLQEAIDEYYCDEDGYYQSLVDAPYLVTMDEVNRDVAKYIKENEGWADNSIVYYKMKDRK